MDKWLSKVGLPYHSPRMFRHGHAVYALKNAKDVSALKAVRQNLMHQNLTITEESYLKKTSGNRLLILVKKLKA